MRSNESFCSNIQSAVRDVQIFDSQTRDNAIRQNVLLFIIRRVGAPVDNLFIALQGYAFDALQGFILINYRCDIYAARNLFFFSFQE